MRTTVQRSRRPSLPSLLTLAPLALTAATAVAAAQPQLLVPQTPPPPPLPTPPATASGCCVPAVCAPSRPQAAAEREALAYDDVRVAGSVLHGTLEELRRRLAWYRDVRAAVCAARAAQKPLVWIQLLGELDGFA